MLAKKIQQLEALTRSFPSLRRRVAPELFKPWDAVRFAKYCVPMSSGEKEAALFVLSVWNWMDDWSEFGLVAAPAGEANRGRFDVHRALSRWDDEHVKAFVAWAAAPWWC
ncbi:MAG: hypothetical protein ACOY0T_31020 [Myxococcota bacterium]